MVFDFYFDGVTVKTGNKLEWDNRFIKNNQEILLDLADFVFQEQPEDNLMVSISRACYTGSHTMADKPIKNLESLTQ